MEVCCGIPIDRSTHLWGTETVLCAVKTGEDTEGKAYGYTGKEMEVLPNGNVSSVHFHIRKTETFYVERGNLELDIFRPLERFWAWPMEQREGGSDPFKDRSPLQIAYHAVLLPGKIITILPGTPHRFFARENVVIFKEFSTWDDPEDSLKIIPAGTLESQGPLVWYKPEQKAKEYRDLDSSCGE